MSSPADAVQRQRAAQYAACTYSLTQDPMIDGAEAIFDQALTNGLAAIVAHEWPGSETGGRGVLSASALLDLIRDKGKQAESGTRLLRGDEPEWITWPFDEEPAPNFTLVQVDVLKCGLEAAQAIRHARDNGVAAPRTLTAEHLSALEELDAHPALFALTDEHINRAVLGIAAQHTAEQQRAATYWQALAPDEQARRKAINYAAAHAYDDGAERCEVLECPVCDLDAFVGAEFDSHLDEVPIGLCHACSYTRTRPIADDMAASLQLSRAIERND